MHAPISIQLSLEEDPLEFSRVLSEQLSPHQYSTRGALAVLASQTPSSVSSSQFQCQALPGFHLTAPCPRNFLQVKLGDCRACLVFSCFSWITDLYCLVSNVFTLFHTVHIFVAISRKTVSSLFVSTWWVEIKVEFTLEMNLDRPTCIQLYCSLNFSAGNAPEGKLNMPPQNAPL